jgi:hypothetical protein
MARVTRKLKDGVGVEFAPSIVKDL